ncbi:MAG TPA: hypothetical protein VK177_13515, partial [Flavobacteriales bacterium]|nr:hypothetical protein [Flavobacteriales bacterium]
AYRLPYWQTGFVNAQARFGRAFSCPWFSFSIYVAVKTPEMWNTYARLHEWGGATLGFKW